MNALVSMILVMIIYAVGELVAAKTKARLSATLVIAVLMLFGFWLGMPADIIKVAGITPIAMVLVSFLITSLGTTMTLKQLKAQWKTVVVSITGVVIGVTLIVTFGGKIIGNEMALVGSPIFAGGNAAALMLKDSLSKKGMTQLFNFSLMVLVLQSFVGIPIASYVLRKEALKFRENPENIINYSTEILKKEENSKKKLISFPEGFDTPMIRFIKLGIVAAIGFYISSLTKGKVHPFVMGLLLAVFFTEIGFLEENILNKINSATFILFITTVVIFSSLATVTPTDILNMLYPTLVVLLLGVVGVIISGIILGRVLNIGTYLAITLGLTCTFGFPTTLFMSQEVSQAMGRTPEEKEALLNYLLPSMLTGGFVTVTIASVFIAGIIIGLV